MSHFDELALLTPDIGSRRILDVGAGRGGFVIDCVMRGVNARGIEYSPAYIAEAYKQAEDKGVAIDIVQGEAERLPFADGSFDFLNFSEVIEHVRDPKAALREAYRVLAPGGRAYISVPNRFGLRDQHYHLYFVNWLPRSLSEPFIRLFGREKHDSGHAGHQKLSEMHYSTYRTFGRMAERAGFEYMDIRAQKLKRVLGSAGCRVALPLYIVARTIYLDAFHFLLVKNGS